MRGSLRILNKRYPTRGGNTWIGTERLQQIFSAFLTQLEFKASVRRRLKFCFYSVSGQPQNKLDWWFCSMFKWASLLLTALSSGQLIYHNTLNFWFPVRAELLSALLGSEAEVCWKQMDSSVCQVKPCPGLFAGQFGLFPSTCHCCAQAGRWRGLQGLKGRGVFWDL